MSTILHPVGPQPSRVYWVRRLTALIVLVLVIGLVAFAVSRMGGGSDAAADPAPSASASATTPTPTPTAELVEGAPCLPDNLRIDALTDQVSYQAGESPQLSFTITNTAGVACTFNVGSSQQSYVITSGQDTYWSSRDCLVDPSDTSITLEPNLSQTSASLTWDRTRSAADTCSGERPGVPAGGATYALTVTVGPVSSAPASFLVY